MAKADSTPEPTASEPVASALELAMLAATLNPDGCRAGACRDALFHAMALFEESAAFCNEIGPKSPMERVRWLHELSMQSHGQGLSGAAHLYEVLADRIFNAPPPVLILATTNGAEDTLRPYLAKHANLEGTTGRKSWSQVRTVLASLERMFIDRANESNRHNADKIQRREARDEAEAVAKGMTVEQLHGSGWSYHHDEIWNDGQADFKEAVARWTVRDELPPNGIIRYDIPKAIVDALIAWRRKVRRNKGGIKAVRLQTRAEVFSPTAKKKLPKKRK